MSFKSRILRIALIVLGVLLFAGYFAFSTFFFNPFESALNFDVAALAPRNVDFFVAKARLSDWLSPFPELKHKAAFEKNPAWKSWVESPEWKGLERDLQLEQNLKELKTQLDQIPFGTDLLTVFGGSDLAIAGYFRGADLKQTDWVVYGRANWMGKLGAAALRHPGLIGLEKQGLHAAVEEEYVALSGGQLPRELYITRIKDVVVIATTPELAKKAHELDRKQYEDSLHQSANYHDFIQARERNADADEVEIYVNARKLVENLGFKGEWPNTKSQDFTPALLGRLFQLGSLKNLMGLAGVDGGLQLDFHGEFSSELITKEQEKLYRMRGFDRAQLMGDAGDLCPADAGLFLYAHAHVGDMLRASFAAMEPALRQNIEDAFRSTGKYQNLEQLITQLDAALKDRAVLIVRKNDYPPDAEGPKNHTDEPVPAIALVLWMKEAKLIDELRQTIGEKGQQFGLKGRNETEIGYFKYFEAGYETREYWSGAIPGTGVIATVTAGDMLIITNCVRMIAHLLKVQTQGGDKYPRLSDDPRFESLVQSALPRSNVLAWLNPATLAPIVREELRYNASSSVNVDWKAITPLEERKILQASYKGRAREQLTEEELVAFEAALDARLAQLEETFKNQQLPVLAGERERWLEWFEATDGVLTMLALDPKSWDFTLRAPIPLVRR